MYEQRLYSVLLWIWNVSIIARHRRKDDLKTDESKVIFIKSRQSLCQLFDLKSIIKERWLSDFKV
jgi:hypothetical protein